MSERVAVFLPSLAGGGAERMMLRIAGAIAEQGYAVDLVVVRGDGPLAGAIPEGVRLVDFRAARGVLALVPLMRYLRRTRPRALLATLPVGNFLAALARRIGSRGTRLVLRQANTFSCTRANGGLRQRWLLPALQRWAYHSADAIVAPSRGVASDLADCCRLHRKRIQVIHNPSAAPEVIRRAGERPVLEHLVGGWPVILGVGRLVPQKDFATLIRAFALLPADWRARLVILGEGRERRRLERLAGELGVAARVHLPGFAANPYAYMRRATMFVLSSRWEGFPNALAEAMACGARVLSTDCPHGPREILAHGRYGPLVPPGDPSAMAAAIQRHLADPVGSDTTAAAARFTPQRLVPQYLRAIGLRERDSPLPAASATDTGCADTGIHPAKGPSARLGANQRSPQSTSSSGTETEAGGGAA